MLQADSRDLRYGNQRMTHRQKQDTLRKRQPMAKLLSAVPHANEAMEIKSRSGGGVLASVPMERSRMLVPPLSWILPYSSHRRVELDVLGASVLKMCDGRTTVESIIETFSVRHRLSFRESQLAVTQFLRQLVQRGVVAIVGLGENLDE